MIGYSLKISDMIPVGLVLTGPNQQGIYKLDPKIMCFSLAYTVSVYV